MWMRWLWELEEITIWLIPGILSLKWKRRSDENDRAGCNRALL